MNMNFFRLLKGLLMILSVLTGLNVGLQGQNELSGRGVVLDQLIVREVKPLNDRGFVVVRTNEPEFPTKLGLQYFDWAEQKQKSEKLLNFRQRGVDGQLEDSFVWNDRLHLVYSRYHPGPKRNYLFYDQYSLPDLEKIVSKQIEEAYTPGLYRLPFGYSISPDSSKILFYAWSYALPDAPAKLTLKVFDDEMNLLWKSRYILPYRNETLFLYGCRVTNDGNAFILGEDYQGRVGANMQIRLEKVKRFALFVEAGKKDFLEYTVSLGEDHVVTDMKFTMDDDNNLLAVGYYKTRKKYRLSGLFSYGIDYQTKKSELARYPVSKEQYQASYAYADKEGAFSSKKKGFADYFIDHVLVDDDGGITVVGEQQVESESLTFSAEGPGFGLDYNDVLVARLEKSRVRWLLRLPKRQTPVWGGDHPAYSYGMLKNGEELLILFNDNLSNHERESMKSVADFNQGSKVANMLFRVLPDGNFKKYNISEQVRTGDRKTYLTPGICWKVSDNQVVIYAETGVLSGKSSGRFIAVNLAEL